MSVSSTDKIDEVMAQVSFNQGLEATKRVLELTNACLLLSQRIDLANRRIRAIEVCLGRVVFSVVFTMSWLVYLMWK